MATQTLALVVRVSRMGARKEDDERFYSKADQVRDGTRLAETAGYRVHVYDNDLNVSGATPFDERPGMGAALRDLEAGRVAGIVTAARDRLVRQDPAAGVTLQALQARIRAAGGVLIVGDTPDACVGRPGDRVAEGLSALGLDVLVAYDGRFREEMGKRWRTANRNAIRRGVQPGPTPSWLDRDDDGHFHPNEHTPAVVEAVHARAAGASWSKVADLLNERGVPTRGGGPWTYKTAERVCRNELLVGVVSWGQYRKERAFEPLVDEATFLLASQRKERPKGYRDREPGLATGTAVCAGCRHRMIQDRSKRRDGVVIDVYRCRSGECDSPATISHSKLEPFLWEAARSQRSLRRMRRRRRGAPRPATDELKAALRQAEAEVAAFLQRVKPTTPGFSDALERHEEAVELARDRLAESAEHTRPTLQELWAEDEFNATDPARRRAFVQMAIERALVTKGRGPAEERVEIVWR